MFQKDFGKDFDVTTNIKMTENLQCQLLSGVSGFFSAMEADKTKAEKAEILADIEIALYLLAARMGVSKESLDKKALTKAKLRLLEEDRLLWKSALLDLVQGMEKQR